MVLTKRSAALMDQPLMGVATHMLGKKVIIGLVMCGKGGGFSWFLQNWNVT